MMPDTSFPVTRPSMFAARQGAFMWGRMASCAAIGNRRACRLAIGTQLTKLPHKNVSALLFLSVALIALAMPLCAADSPTEQGVSAFQHGRYVEACRLGRPAGGGRETGGLELRPEAIGLRFRPDRDPCLRILLEPETGRPERRARRSHVPHVRREAGAASSPGGRGRGAGCTRRA